MLYNFSCLHLTNVCYKLECLYWETYPAKVLCLWVRSGAYLRVENLTFSQAGEETNDLIIFLYFLTFFFCAIVAPDVSFY